MPHFPNAAPIRAAVSGRHGSADNMKYNSIESSSFSSTLSSFEDALNILLDLITIAGLLYLGKPDCQVSALLSSIISPQRLTRNCCQGSGPQMWGLRHKTSGKNHEVPFGGLPGSPTCICTTSGPPEPLPKLELPRDTFLRKPDCISRMT